MLFSFLKDAQDNTSYNLVWAMNEKTVGTLKDNKDGLLLLCFFIIFLGYTFAIAFQGKKEGEAPDEEIKQLPMWRSALYIIGGLAGLIIGGNFFVDGATGVARSLGVS